MNRQIGRSWIFMAIVLSTFAESTAQAQRITAREVVAEIQKQVGVEWRQETVDTFKAGNPDTPVTGIAVTMMATMDVLQRASAEGLNFVITHEPTFYAHLDQPEGMPESDPVWAEKRAFIEKHGMVVWRFHDHWHMRKPDGIEAGMVRLLGWEKFQNSENQYRGSGWNRLAEHGSRRNLRQKFVPRFTLLRASLLGEGLDSAGYLSVSYGHLRYRPCNVPSCVGASGGRVSAWAPTRFSMKNLHRRKLVKTAQLPLKSYN